DKKPVLSDAGRVLPSAHRWASQIADDLAALADITGSEDIADAVQYPLRLFTDSGIRDAFILAD
ncbi:unnamed protein product, partial [Prorocentrum cordatum]